MHDKGHAKDRCLMNEDDPGFQVKFNEEFTQMPKKMTKNIETMVICFFFVCLSSTSGKRI